MLGIGVIIVVAVEEEVRYVGSMNRCGSNTMQGITTQAQGEGKMREQRVESSRKIVRK